MANPMNDTSQDQLKNAETILFGEQKWPRLVVRGLYRYEHAGFGGAFEPGNPVTLEREPGNAIDPNAVKVILQDGKMLGYIAKEMAAVISKELARGMKFVTLIAKSQFVESKWGQCELDIIFKISERDFEYLELLAWLDRDAVMRYYSSARPYIEPCVWAQCGGYTHLLGDAVMRNDVKTAQSLVATGSDVNEMLFVLAKSDGAHTVRFAFYTSPILMTIRSVEMYKLFAKSGAELHPHSFIRHYGPSWNIYGKEHNLLDVLWRGPKMDDQTIELADYLVFTGYDIALRSKISEIRLLCESDIVTCPYKNNLDYVLEWCDMEKRAIASACVCCNEIIRREGISHHSLGWDFGNFIGDWKESGYEQALVWHSGEIDDEILPPRYVYPERILKRGFDRRRDQGVI